MTSLNLLAISDTPNYLAKEKHNWVALSNLTHLTRLDLDLPILTSDRLTRLTSLQFIYKRGIHVSRYSDEENALEDGQPVKPLADWPTFISKFPNLLAVAQTATSSYLDPWSISDLDSTYHKRD